ncbi:MAG: transcription-repair coupling factor, partial [Flavobacteriaceae bacterium]
MTPSSILQHFVRSPEIGKLRESLVPNAKNIQVKGLSGSSWSLVTASLFKSLDRPFLVIFNDKEEAAYFLNDLENLLGDKNVLFYPGSYRRPYQIEETDNANVLLRAEVLNRINSRQKPALIVTYPDALFEKVVSRKELDKKTLRIRLGDALSLDFLNEVLFEYQFKRVDFVS